MELLEQYLALTTIEDRTAFLANLPADQLVELRTAAQAEFDAIPGTSDDDLTSMQSLAAVLTEVADEDTRRTNEATRLATEAQALRDQVAGLTPAAEVELDDEGNPIVAEPELDENGEPIVAPELDADGNPVVPVAAAAPAPRTVPIRAVARRQPAPRPVVAAAAEVAPLTASADVPGFGMGQAFESNAQIADAFLRRFDAVRRSKGGASGDKIIVASATGSYGDDRMLGSDPVRNTELIQAVMDAFMSGNEQAIVAAGGLCAPTTVRYDQPTLGTTERPIRDNALVRFGATRGGVRWIPAPRLLNISSANPAAVSVWDVDTDTDPGDTTKPCATFTCPSEVEELIEAVVRCLQFGNFLDRTFRERIDAILALVNVWFARFAEQNLVTKIDAMSTAVSSGQGLGATSDMLAALGRLVTGRESYERLGEGVRFTWLAPSWVPDMLREDLARQMPAHNTTDEQYALADEAIARWLSMRNIDPVWSPDMQVFGNQGIGPINGWPSTIVGYLYPRGTVAFLDGGTLDLGIVRDSTLNAQNNFQMFMETFEGAAHFGPLDVYKTTLDVCPNGTASALTDFDPCSTGS